MEQEVEKKRRKNEDAKAGNKKVKRDGQKEEKADGKGKNNKSKNKKGKEGMKE